MSEAAPALARPAAAGASPARAWLVVARQEARDLWLGGRTPLLLLAFALVLSAITYLLATDRELSLLDQRSMASLVAQLSVVVGALLALLVAGDALSGERERATLEGLLVTPAPRGGVVLGKVLAAWSVWLGAFLVAVPYLAVVAVGTGREADVLGLALLAGAGLGLAFAGLGVAVSAVAGNNRTSLAASLLLFLALLAPSQLPASAKKGWLADALLLGDPVTAGGRAIDQVVVSNHAWAEQASRLGVVGGFAVAALLLAALAARRLRLSGGGA